MSKLINELIKLNQSTQEDPYGKILTFSEDKVKNLVLDDISREILTKHGIPKDVSPFLSFYPEEKGGFDSLGNFIKRHTIEGMEVPKMEGLDTCYLFGEFNNWFLALDEKGQVLYISNESFEATYANKDLTTFLTIIVRFNTMIEDYLDVNPEGDFFEDVVNEEMIEEFADYIEELDENAVGNDTFWDELLECVLDC